MGSNKFNKIDKPIYDSQAVSHFNEEYKNNKLGWDIGYVSPPLQTYFDQVENKSLKVLVPGAGNGWEVEYLHRKGFMQTYLLDFSKYAIQGFRKRYPDFPEKNIFFEDFFYHKGEYDLIVEQTFFSSFPKKFRKEYAIQIMKLLRPGGKLVGLLFNHEFIRPGPPFGGNPEEFKKLFSNYFKIKTFATSYNSIKPRHGREVFMILEKL